MDYWKSKILPKIKKVFEKNGTKKAAAAEASKSFDESKDEINKEFEEKKAELQPKVIEIYEASSAEIKTLVKKPKEAGLKKNSTAVHKFLEELVKIEFPGSKPISEASSKFGAALIPGPIFFIFEKVSRFIVAEEKPAEETKEERAIVPPPRSEATAEGEETSTTATEREIVVEEGKKIEPPADKTEPSAEPSATIPAEPAAKEDQPAAEPPKP